MKNCRIFYKSEWSDRCLSGRRWGHLTNPVSIIAHLQPIKVQRRARNLSAEIAASDVAAKTTFDLQAHEKMKTKKKNARVQCRCQ